MSRSWRKETASREAFKVNGSCSEPKKLQDETKLESMTTASVSIQSVLFCMRIVVMTDVATALIRLQNAIVFPA